MPSNLSQFSQKKVSIKLCDGCDLTIFANSDLDKNTLLKLTVDESQANGEEVIQLLMALQL